MWTSAPLGDGLLRIWFDLVSTTSAVLLLFELGFAKILMTAGGKPLDPIRNVASVVGLNCLPPPPLLCPYSNLASPRS